MAVFLSSDAPDFKSRLVCRLERGTKNDADLGQRVASIIAEVQARGDEALFAYTKQFDRLSLTPETVRVSTDKISAGRQNIPQAQLAALELAAQRIRHYHEKQVPPDHHYTDEAGVSLGWRWNAVEAVGLYVPGGQATYPSSVLMNAIPAKVAGVERLAMVVPTPDGQINPLLLAAASIAQIDEIYTIGGAQAIAALAFGTQSVQAVDKIVGPGNAYVAEAKRQVYGTVGIDMIAGPSEICVVADASAPAKWIAHDLLSQSEHDADAQSILISDDRALLDAVSHEVDTILARHPRQEIAKKAWDAHGIIIHARPADIPGIINLIAPEHLQLAVKNPDSLADKVRHAGAIFMGIYTPEAIGDYVAGPDHVLPTSRTARFSSGLSTTDFMKRTSFTSLPPSALKIIGPAAAELAMAEGLPSHGDSVLVRLAELEDDG